MVSEWRSRPSLRHDLGLENNWDWCTAPGIHCGIHRRETCKILGSCRNKVIDHGFIDAQLSNNCAGQNTPWVTTPMWSKSLVASQTNDPVNQSANLEELRVTLASTVIRTQNICLYPGLIRHESNFPNVSRVERWCAVAIRQYIFQAQNLGIISI